MENKEKTDEWVDFLYFAYKKAKYFVTRETSFVENFEIIQFEESLHKNILELAELLNNSNDLEEEIKEMKGYLYFFPKSFGPNKEARIRPKVAFPFKYQILWAAIILRIGEWFDTNSRLKNVYSMRDEDIRKELEWMVPWSFNGRIKRLPSQKGEDILESSYIQYNSSRLYESHQMALKKFYTYENKVVKKLFEYNQTVFKAELDIQEFFPTLKKRHIESIFEERFKELGTLNCFEKKYFEPQKMLVIIKILLNIEIDFPDKIKETDPITEVIIEYYKKISKDEKLKDNETVLLKILEKLNDTLPLDLIASNFLSNCVLNHFIDKKIKSKYRDNNVFILRYTDDYAVISNDKDEVKNVIHEIKNHLKSIELNYSNEKTLPTTVCDLEKRLEVICEHNNWKEEYSTQIKLWCDFSSIKEKYDLLKEIPVQILKEIKLKLSMLGMEIEPKEIKKDNIGRELSISKLSKTSDTKLHALSDDELKMYMEELMVFMQAKGEIGELKEETTKIFAAWRLNASHKELTYRKRYKYEDVENFLSMLEETIRQYPYKLGFYDIYVLILFRVIEQDTTNGFDKFKDFLLRIKPMIESSFENAESTGDFSKPERFMSSCFPTIRIRILNLISSNWGRFDEQKRGNFRAILEEVFLKWYAKPRIYWHELYTLYSSLAILRIRLPLEICSVEEEHPKFLLNIAQVYEKYFFLTNPEIEKINEESEMKKEEGDDNKIGIVINLLKLGLYWNEFDERYEFKEIDYLLYERIKKQLKEEQSVSYKTLLFAKIAPEKVKTKEDWHSLFGGNLGDKEDREFKFAILDFLQFYIQLYFEKPKYYSGILAWVTDKQDVENSKSQDNMYKIYVRNRLISYNKIRQYFSLTDKNYSPLLKKKSEEKECIPIADWVFYCQTLPYHLEMSSQKQGVLHPLTEYEFVTLLLKIMKGKKCEEGPEEIVEDPVVKDSLLFKFQMTVEDWTNFRNEQGSEKQDFPPNDLECSPEEIVKVLFTLLTNRPWHTHVRKHFSMYKWNDLQSYFEMTYYPSTLVATLFVNHLNIHQDFYSRYYNMPKEELPYRNVYTNRESEDIDRWIKNYLKYQKEKQVYKTDNRKLELLEIDIDQLRG